MTYSTDPSSKCFLNKPGDEQIADTGELLRGSLLGRPPRLLVPKICVPFISQIAKLPLCRCCRAKEYRRSHRH
jgi:hypothetical protein